MAVIEQERVAEITPIANPVADILDRAADLIERDGWFKIGPDACCDGARPHCVMTALMEVGGGDDFFTPDSGEALRVFQSFVGAYPSTWNDAPGRTKAEVVAALRCASAASHR